MYDLKRIDDVVWEVPASARDDMRVPARVFADAELVDAIRGDGSLEQLCNVATLPGIVEAALAMPDVHQGYGFPVGGVAATAGPEGVVSPGGVGYDINCGVRLLALPLSAEEMGAKRREKLVHELARSVPAGAGREGSAAVTGARRRWRRCCRRGRPRWCAGGWAWRRTWSARSRAAGCRARMRARCPSGRATAARGRSARSARATTSWSCNGSTRCSSRRRRRRTGCARGS